MKNTMALFGMGLAAIIISSAAFAQKTPDAKKTRHIKMMKIENGKKMELDTVLAGNDVFVWNGDTINPEKHIKKFNPSGFDKIHHIDVNVDRKDGKEKVMIYKHRGGKTGEPMIWNMDSAENMEIIPEHSARVIDLNDPNIISYKQKNLSGDREKIEIIRKKSEEPENMNFDFKVGDSMIAPPPPPAPMDEFNNEESGKKIIRKDMKVEEKKMKEETAPNENK